MAAIAPPLAMITIIAIVFYLARRSAYKKINPPRRACLTLASLYLL